MNTSTFVFGIDNKKVLLKKFFPMIFQQSIHFYIPVEKLFVTMNKAESQRERDTKTERIQHRELIKNISGLYVLGMFC